MREDRVVWSVKCNKHFGTAGMQSVAPILSLITIPHLLLVQDFILVCIQRMAWVSLTLELLHVMHTITCSSETGGTDLCSKNRHSLSGSIVGG